MDTSNQQLIPIQEVMMWIAKMAAKDGVSHSVREPKVSIC